MASRQETAERTRALVTELRARIRRGDFPAGTRIPALDVLGRRHGLSKPTVLAALQPLIADGTLESRTRVGIFVADASRSAGVHVIVTSRRQTQAAIVRKAFTARIDELGGETLALDVAEFLRLARADLPPVLGAFVFTHERTGDVVAALDSTVPIVRYGPADDTDADPRTVTHVDLDNADAGTRAARELLFSGHSQIAFLGMHGADHRWYPWSSRRAAGAAEVVRHHQSRTPLLQVMAPWPIGSVRLSEQSVSTRVRARVAILAADRRDEFSACIGADDHMVAALSHELRARGVPEADWPVMVGVEGLPTGAATHVASVVPGWAALGARAGQVLFDGATGRRSHTGQVELVPATGVTPRRRGLPSAS